MRLRSFITKGKAVFVGEDLRCGSPRVSDPTKSCNRLLVKRNQQGQIAGNFLCDRCKQIVEVKLAPTS